MKKLSTRSTKHKNNWDEEADLKYETSPRKKTISYLTQFARVYCSEKTVYAGQGEFVLN